MRVRVLRPFEYDRRMLAADEEIDLEDHFVLPLKLDGKVEVVVGERKRYRRRDMRAEE